MKRLDIKAMKEALQTIKSICNEYRGKGCVSCPARGYGRLCHSGEISCCAPHRWWGVEEAEDEQAD